jgi:putative transposase
MRSLLSRDSTKGNDVTCENAVLDELLKECKTPAEIFGENGLLKRLTDAVLIRALQADLPSDRHLEAFYPMGETGDRDGVPHLRAALPTWSAPLPEGELPERLKAKIVLHYASGRSPDEIRQYLADTSEMRCSSSLVAKIINEVADEVTTWQNRQLDAVYPFVFLDCLKVKVRDSGRLASRTVFLALGLTLDGDKEVLGTWLGEAEDARLGLQLVSDLYRRGVRDVFIACAPGLPGFPGAVTSFFPGARVLLSVVHLVRSSLTFVSYKQRNEVSADLKLIYQADTLGQAEAALTGFATKWDAAYPTIGQLWYRNWEQLKPYFAYHPDIRKVMSTASTLESLNLSLVKITRAYEFPPNCQLLLMVLHVALLGIAKTTRPVRDWKAAMCRFTILFEDRIPSR